MLAQKHKQEWGWMELQDTVWMPCRNRNVTVLAFAVVSVRGGSMTEIFDVSSSLSRRPLFFFQPLCAGRGREKRLYGRGNRSPAADASQSDMIGSRLHSSFEFVYSQAIRIEAEKGRTLNQLWKPAALSRKPIQNAAAIVVAAILPLTLLQNCCP